MSVAPFWTVKLPAAALVTKPANGARRAGVAVDVRRSTVEHDARRVRRDRGADEPQDPAAAGLPRPASQRARSEMVGPCTVIVPPVSDAIFPSLVIDPPELAPTVPPEPWIAIPSPIESVSPEVGTVRPGARIVVERDCPGSSQRLRSNKSEASVALHRDRAESSVRPSLIVIDCPTTRLPSSVTPSRVPPACVAVSEAPLVWGDGAPHDRGAGAHRPG